MTGPQLKRRVACSEPTPEESPPLDASAASLCESAEGGATDEERELMEAIREYQCASKRMFPTWSEILEIVQQLGYRKPD